MQVNRFEIYTVNLDPAKGSEKNKKCPCVVISPNELNHLATVIVAPLTSKGFELPSRVAVNLNGKPALILLDHLRSIDKMRLTERVGMLNSEEQQEICEVLQEMFAY